MIYGPDNFTFKPAPFYPFTNTKSLDKAMEGTLGDYVIVSVAETAIMDVYRYKTAEDAQEQ